MKTEEIATSCELLKSLIDEVIKPCQIVAPADEEEAMMKIVTDVVAIHVPKLLDYINKLENMPLVKTVLEKEREIERLRNVIFTEIERNTFYNREKIDGFTPTGLRLRDAMRLEGESHERSVSSENHA